MNNIGGKYQLLKILGSGNFGTTYLAVDQYGKNYAVKQLTFSSNEPNKIAIAQRKFNDEKEILQKLHHQQIPDFVDYIAENQQYYLIQQYIHGETLREKLHKDKNLSIEKSQKILLDILKILDYIHKKGIIHRDIKPDNIMIDHNDKLFLIDFGAVKAENPNDTKLQTPGTNIFSRGYAPIEQMRGYPEKNSDIYALGMTIIELITGLKPENLTDTWYRDINIIPDDLKEILCKMIDEYQDTRYQSAQEIIKDLQKPPSVQKTIPLSNGKINNSSVIISSRSGTDMILFGVMFTLISILIFHTAMLPGMNKQNEQIPGTTGKFIKSE